MRKLFTNIGNIKIVRLSEILNKINRKVCKVAAFKTNLNDSTLDLKNKI